MSKGSRSVVATEPTARIDVVSGELAYGRGAPGAVSPSVEYARRLYDNVLGWYQNADGKAQIILGLDGAFLAFLTAATFQKPDDLARLIAKFSPWTWRWLGLMATTLTASMAAAIYCLWSRIFFRASRVVDRLRLESKAASVDEYPPGVMWFFQHIAVLDPLMFRNTLARVNGPFEVEALARQVEKLSENVRRKHIAVNCGFAFAIVTLALFAAAAASYVVSVMSAG